MTQTQKLVFQGVSGVEPVNEQDTSRRFRVTYRWSEPDVGIETEMTVTLTLEETIPGEDKETTEFNLAHQARRLLSKRLVTLGRHLQNEANQ